HCLSRDIFPQGAWKMASHLCETDGTKSSGRHIAHFGQGFLEHWSRDVTDQPCRIVGVCQAVQDTQCRDAALGPPLKTGEQRSECSAGLLAVIQSRSWQKQSLA